MQRQISGALCASFLAFAAAPALAHATLEGKATPAGAAYRAVIRIGHGCDGQATNTLRVSLPEGFYDARPMPKAGWALETVKGAYATPFDDHGTAMTEGTREVIWSGGGLRDEWYDEFVIRGTVGKDLAPGTLLHFPVVQECASARVGWTDVSGKAGVANPAPAVAVTAAGSDGHANAAAAVRLGDLELSGVHARATPPGAPVAGGFLTIANAGAEDRLTGVGAPAITDRAEIHEMAMEGDVMRMRALPDGLPIPAHATVELKPGGHHIMFMELKQPLTEGMRVDLTLHFEKAGEVVVPMQVGPMNAGKKARQGGGHAGH